MLQEEETFRHELRGVGPSEMINISQCDESRFKLIVKDPYLYYQKKKIHICI